MEAAAALLEADRSQPVSEADGETVTVWNRQFQRRQHGFREGPQWRIEVSPGTIAVRSTDMARRERRLNRNADDVAPGRGGALDGPVCLVGSCLHSSCREMRARRADYSYDEDEPRHRGSRGPICLDSRCGHVSCDAMRSRGRVVVTWSRKSRSRMIERLASLDYAPMLGDGSRSPVMLTLTYPGDWLAVVPSSKVAMAHFRKLQGRYKRKFGQPMVAVWKREFQRRGAPHFHILVVPPCSFADFASWVSTAWSEIVNHPDPEERARHLRAGTGVDVAKGAQMRDPRRVGFYFAKHGVYSDKDYQNEAPSEWLDSGEGVGRFWGVLGLKPAVARVKVSPAAALHVSRILARWSLANRHTRKMPGEKFPRQVVELHAYGHMGTMRPRNKRRYKRMRRTAGYIVLNDAPAILSAIARQLDQWEGRSSPVITGRSGCGPVGDLP